MNKRQSSFDKTKDKVEGLVRKASDKIEDIKDSGDLSSETTIEPNREGPSPLDKINKKYGDFVEGVEKKLPESIEKKLE